MNRWDPDEDRQPPERGEDPDPDRNCMVCDKPIGHGYACPSCREDDEPSEYELPPSILEAVKKTAAARELQSCASRVVAEFERMESPLSVSMGSLELLRRALLAYERVRKGAK